MFFAFLTFFYSRKKRIKRNYNRKLFKKRAKRKRSWKKLGVLHITFKRRNVFFNLSTQFFQTLFLTTVRKQGFLGRRRQEYISIYSTMRIVKRKFKRYKLKKLSVIYNG